MREIRVTCANGHTFEAIGLSEFSWTSALSQLDDWKRCHETFYLKDDNTPAPLCGFQKKLKGGG